MWSICWLQAASSPGFHLPPEMGRQQGLHLQGNVGLCYYHNESFKICSDVFNIVKPKKHMIQKHRMPFSFLLCLVLFCVCVGPCLNWTLPIMRGGVCHKPCFLSTELAPQRGWSNLLACKANRLVGDRCIDNVCLSLVFKSILNSFAFGNCCRFWKCAKQKTLYRSSSSWRKEACSSSSHHQTYLGKIWISSLQTAKKFPRHWVKSIPLWGSSFSLSVIDKLV